MSDQFENISFVAISAAHDGLLLTIDLGEAQSVSGLDLTDVTCTNSKVAQLQAETSPDAVDWSQIDDVAKCKQSPSSKRLLLPAGTVRTVRYIRLVCLNIADLAAETLKIAAISVLTETGLSDAVMMSLTYDDTSSNLVIVGGNNGEVYLNGVRQASLAIPHSDSLLPRTNFAQRLDTGLLFHQKVAPFKIFQQGETTQWDSRPLEFDDMLLAQFPGETYPNAKSEKQTISLSDFSADEQFTLTFDAVSTAAIDFASAGATTATRIQTALEDIGTVGAGNLTVSYTGGNSTNQRFTVTFENELASKALPQMSWEIVDSEKGVITIATIQEGDAGGEPIISEKRGWPRDGIFSKGRLILVGLQSDPLTIIASKVNAYFNFAQGNLRADDAIEMQMDADTGDGINHVAAGRFLQFFSSQKIVFIAASNLLADELNPPVPAEAEGSHFSIAPASMGGSIFYVENGGNNIHELVYSDSQATYLSQNISVRASHLIDKPTGLHARPPGYETKASALFVMREDGELPVFVTLPEQSVAAWMRYATDGKILRVCADKTGQLYAVIEQEIDGDTRRYVGLFMPSRTLDCSILVDLDDDATVSVPHLEGRQVWAVGNDEAFGPLTVTDGVVTFPEPRTGQYEIGLWFDAFIDLLPPYIELQGSNISDELQRIMSVSVRLLSSMPPAVTVAGQTYVYQPERDLVLGEGPLAPPYVTGTLRLHGFKGWRRRPDTKISRAWPGPWQVLSVKREVQI